MKRLLIGFLFLPTLCFADRLGSLRSGADVILTTQAVQNTLTPTISTQKFSVDNGSFTASLTTPLINLSGKLNVVKYQDGSNLISFPDAFTSYLGYGTAQIRSGDTFNTCYGSGCMTFVNSETFSSCMGTSCMGSAIMSGQQNNCQGYGCQANRTAASFNTCVGGSCQNNVGNDNNACVGSVCQANLGNSFNNSCVGHQCQQFLTTGFDNTGLGYQAGSGTATVNADTGGIFNLHVGYQSGQGVPSATVLSKCTSIGYQALCDASNQTQIGGRPGSGNEVAVRLTSITVEGTLATVGGKNVCLQDGTNCLAATGGGGASTLEVFAGVSRSSPTASISISTVTFTAGVTGSTFVITGLNSSSVTLQGNSITFTALQAYDLLVGASTGSLQTQVTATGVSTGTIQTQVTATGVSTGSLQAQFLVVGLTTAALRTADIAIAVTTTTLQTNINAVGVSTGSLQAQVTATGVSTGTLQTQIAATGVSTGTLQTQVTATGVSTGTLQTQVTATGVSTGTLSQNFPVSLSTNTMGVLANASINVVVVKSTSDVTIAPATAALGTLPNLGTSLLANTTYQFEFYMVFQSSFTTNGVGFAVSYSGTTFTIAYVGNIPVAADGTSGMFHGAGTSSGDAIIGDAVPGASTSYVAELFGVIVTNSAGTLLPSIRAELNNASAISMRNSFGIITKLP